MTDLSVPIPPPLRRDGHVHFTSPDAAICFDAFALWARNTANETVIDLKSLVEFYSDFKSSNEDDLRDAPHASTSTFVPAWIDPTLYVLSRQLHDGFFSRVWLQNAATDTVTKRDYWHKLATRMRGSGDAFDVEEATKAVHIEAVETQRTGSGSYIHCLGYGGRHRVLALKALHAPAFPVLLRV